MKRYYQVDNTYFKVSEDLENYIIVSQISLEMVIVKILKKKDFYNLNPKEISFEEFSGRVTEIIMKIIL